MAHRARRDVASVTSANDRGLRAELTVAGSNLMVGDRETVTIIVEDGRFHQARYGGNNDQQVDESLLQEAELAVLVCGYPASTKGTPLTI